MMFSRKTAAFAGAVVLGLGALVWGLGLVGGPWAEAASVTPEFLSGASNRGKSCADLQGPGQTWIEFKLDADLSNGPHSQGPLTITISNLNGDSFDWTSNIGVDAVIVKGGNAGSYIYRYDPPSESTGDTGLDVPFPENNGISHVSFCYDVETPTPSPTPTPPPCPPGGDVEKVSLTVGTRDLVTGECTGPAPTEMGVNVLTDVCIRQVVRNNGSQEACVLDVLQAAAWESCDVWPRQIEFPVTLPPNSTVTLPDADFDIMCYRLATHGFTFQDYIYIDGGLVDHILINFLINITG